MDYKLTKELADELIHKGMESPDLDYKLEFDNSTGAWMELAKDIYAMANYGGGYIVIGVEDATFAPLGIDPSFHIDTQTWLDKFASWATGDIKLSYLEYETKINGVLKKFPIIQIEGSVRTLIIPKIDGIYLANGKNKTAFKQGVTYTRRVNSSTAASGEEQSSLFWALLKRTTSNLGGQGVPLDVLSVLMNKAKADEVEETLWFNLFPVTELPDYIYSGETDYRNPLEIYQHIESIEQERGDKFERVPAFYMTDSKIYTFSPFNELNPLTICLNGTQEKSSIKDQWLIDPVKVQKLISLLNFNLKKLCNRRKFWYDKRRDRFFRKDTDEEIPIITWKPYKSKTQRQLIYRRFDSEGKTLLYCEHFGGILRFIMLGSRIYLLIEPTRVVTKDGIEALDWKRNTVVSTKNSFYYHNNNYLYDIKLWLQLLAGTKNEIYLGIGEGKITVNIQPLNSSSSFGIREDQHTDEGFLDELKSEPLEYELESEGSDNYNPITESPFEA